MLVVGTHPGRGQTRAQSRSPHECRLPTLSEIPTDRRAAGTQTHYPNCRGRGDTDKYLQIERHFGKKKNPKTKQVQRNKGKINQKHSVNMKLFHMEIIMNEISNV